MKDRQNYFETVDISLTNPETGEEVEISVNTVLYDEYSYDHCYKECKILSWSPQPDWVTEQMIDRAIN